MGQYPPSDHQCGHLLRDFCRISHYRVSGGDVSRRWVPDRTHPASGVISCWQGLRRIPTARREQNKPFAGFLHWSPCGGCTSAPDHARSDQDSAGIPYGGDCGAWGSRMSDSGGCSTEVSSRTRKGLEGRRGAVAARLTTRARSGGGASGRNPRKAR